MLPFNWNILLRILPSDSLHCTPFNCGDADLNDFILHEAPFYEKNNFSLLLPNDDDKHTRLLYYDLKEE